MQLLVQGLIGVYVNRLWLFIIFVDEADGVESDAESDGSSIFGEDDAGEDVVGTPLVDQKSPSSMTKGELDHTDALFKSNSTYSLIDDDNKKPVAPVTGVSLKTSQTFSSDRGEWSFPSFLRYQEKFLKRLYVFGFSD